MALLGGLLVGSTIGLSIDAAVERAASQDKGLITFISLAKKQRLYASIEGVLLLFIGWLWRSGRGMDSLLGGMLVGVAIGMALTLFWKIFKTAAQRDTEF